MKLRATISRISDSLIGTRRPRATDWPGMAEAVRAGAAYLAQGAIYSYLRARSGTQGPRLFQDAGFGAALEICKWEGFAMAAQDLILIIEGDLRAHHAAAHPPQDTRQAAALADLYATALALEPVPEHRAETGWADLVAEFRPRLGFAMAGPPRPADAISIATARRLMDFAPVEDAIRESDFEMVSNNVGFRFVDYKRRLRRDIDLAALGRLIAARAGSAA